MSGFISSAVGSSRLDDNPPSPSMKRSQSQSQSASDDDGDENGPQSSMKGSSKSLLGPTPPGESVNGDDPGVKAMAYFMMIMKGAQGLGTIFPAVVTPDISAWIASTRAQLPAAIQQLQQMGGSAMPSSPSLGGMMGAGPVPSPMAPPVNSTPPPNLSAILSGLSNPAGSPALAGGPPPRLPATNV